MVAKTRIYTDTSVIGGCLDAEFEETSKRLMGAFARGVATIVVSDLTLQELQAAPEKVRAVLDEIPNEHVEFVVFTYEASVLTSLYIDHGAANEKSRVDAQHIATATITRVDVLVSWNFKHIVNLNKIHGYNSVNLRAGYPIIEIRSPLEVLFDEEG